MASLASGEGSRHLGPPTCSWSKRRRRSASYLPRPALHPEAAPADAPYEYRRETVRRSKAAGPVRALNRNGAAIYRRGNVCRMRSFTVSAIPAGASSGIAKHELALISQRT
jgi:hypothetical protein